MFIKRVKRKCSVRGCKGTDCFAVSKAREIGNTVIVCKSCLEDALNSVNEMQSTIKSYIHTDNNAEAPRLFFNAVALGINVTENTDADKTDSAPAHLSADGETVFICPVCHKEFDNERGLKTHIRYCKLQNDKE